MVTINAVYTSTLEKDQLGIVLELEDGTKLKLDPEEAFKVGTAIFRELREVLYP